MWIEHDDSDIKRKLINSYDYEGDDTDNEDDDGDVEKDNGKNCLINQFKTFTSLVHRNGYIRERL